MIKEAAGLDEEFKCDLVYKNPYNGNEAKMAERNQKKKKSKRFTKLDSEVKSKMEAADFVVYKADESDVNPDY